MRPGLGGDAGTEGAAGSSDEGGEPPDEDDDDDDDNTPSGDDDDDDDNTPTPTGQCLGIDIVGDLGWTFGSAANPLSVDATCGAAPAPCDGDPVGTWSAGTQCGWEQLPNPFEEDCPGSTFSVTVSEQTGGIDIAADGTFTWDSSTTATWSFQFDAMACFGESCDQVQAGFQEEDPNATCTASGELCSCDFNETETMMLSGSWSVEEGWLLLSSEEDEEGFQFCPSGDRLDLWQPLASWTETGTSCATETDCETALAAEHEEYYCADPDELEGDE